MMRNNKASWIDRLTDFARAPAWGDRYPVGSHVDSVPGECKQCLKPINSDASHTMVITANVIYNLHQVEMFHLECYRKFIKESGK